MYRTVVQNDQSVLSKKRNETICIQRTSEIFFFTKVTISNGYRLGTDSDGEL